MPIVPVASATTTPAALRHLQTAGYTEVSFFLDRQRQSVAITDALASLR
jgi:hypothetical protein